MKKYTIEIKWAIIFVMVTLLWMLGEKLAGYHDDKIAQHAVITYFFAIPAILIYVLALLDKKKNYYQGHITYKQAFVSGLVLTLIVTIISPLTQYVTSVIISPDYFANMKSFAVSEGKMTEEEAAAFFNLRSYIMQTVIGTFAMGLLTTAIVSIIIMSRKAKA